MYTVFRKPWFLFYCKLYTDIRRNLKSNTANLYRLDFDLMMLNLRGDGEVLTERYLHNSTSSFFKCTLKEKKNIFEKNSLIFLFRFLKQFLSFLSNKSFIFCLSFFIPSIVYLSLSFVFLPFFFIPCQPSWLSSCWYIFSFSLFLTLLLSLFLIVSNTLERPLVVNNCWHLTQTAFKGELEAAGLSSWKSKRNHCLCHFGVDCRLFPPSSDECRGTSSRSRRLLKELAPRQRSTRKLATLGPHFDPLTSRWRRVFLIRRRCLELRVGFKVQASSRAFVANGLGHAIFRKPFLVGRRDNNVRLGDEAVS